MPISNDNKKYGKFLIVGTQRTGSSALAEAINTHPEIACGWEWTERTPCYKKLAVLKRGLDGNFADLNEKSCNHVESSISHETLWLGFRCLFGSSNKWLFTPNYSIKLAWDRFHAHIDWLKKHPSVRIIHIVRNDHVAWLKSMYLAKSLGNFIGAPYPQDIKINIPINEAIARVKSKMYVDRHLGQLRNSNPYIEISYEKLMSDFCTQSSSVVQFLDCGPDLINLDTTVIRKQSTRPDKDYIANYDELVNAMQTQLAG